MWTARRPARADAEPDAADPGPGRRARPPTPAAPRPSPAAPAAAARVTGLPAARGCVKRRRYTRHRQAARRRRASSRSPCSSTAAGAARGPAPRKATLDLKAAKRASVRVRVVVATTAGTVTVARTYRLCGSR